MDLFTKSKDVNWNRIVNLFISENDDLNKNINDKDTCKLIIVTNGAGIAQIDKKTIVYLMENGYNGSKEAPEVKKLRVVRT